MFTVWEESNEVKQYKRFRFLGCFVVECYEYYDPRSDERFDAYIYHDDYGVKDLMFGYGDCIGDFDEFCAVVRGNVSQYAMIYADMYFDGGNDPDDLYDQLDLLEDSLDIVY